jgi:predicted TIM-barrel fold metal-dependent hydrolase
MIVDAHVHLAAPGSRAAGLFPSPAAPADLLRQMDRAGVAGAVVLGLPGLQTAEEVLGLCAAAPDRLFPLLGVHPLAADDLARIPHARGMGFYGLKVHPRLGEFPVDADVLGPALELAERHRLPVLFDALPQSGAVPLDGLEYHAFDRLARRFRGVRMVLAHACAPHVLGAYTVVKANPNVYLDVSFSLLYYAGSSVEMDLGFVSDRIDRHVLYGSDFPQYAADAYLAAYLRLLEGRPGADRRRVLGGNAVELFGLPLPAEGRGSARAAAGADG